MNISEIKTDVGTFKVFTTNHGTHTPELLAEMSLSQLVTEDSHPIKRAEVRQALVDLYAQVQRTAQTLFKHAERNDVLKRAINQILTKDLNTALDIERQFHKE
jgi:hypothetical protein